MKFQWYKDKSGQFRWRLRADNHEILATSSEAYKAKADCAHAIGLIKKGAAKAAVEEDKGK